MGKWTPGPWVVDVSRSSKRGPVNQLMVVAERGGMPGLIVNIGATVTQQDWANAILISKAPEMAELLRRMLDKYGGGIADQHGLIDEHNKIRALLKEIET